MAEHKVDVFIAGAGPVGLLLAYQLERLGISTYTIDAADKSHPSFPMYGRACGLYPRTLEMLDQLDLFDDMAQIGLIARRSVTYQDGKRVQGRGFGIFEGITGTFFDYILNIRLKYSEDTFRKRLEGLGRKVQAPLKLVDLAVDEHAPDDYRVSAVCATVDNRTLEVKSKYIIGADGGSSAVRKLAAIPFNGSDKEDHWVRIDGIVKTNMPESRAGVGTIETKTHDQVLWVALDHGATRIGYVLSPEMFAKYGKHMKQEDAIREAKAAAAPFELEFEQVDWHTVYGVKQHVAERLQDRERILLAGDAAHTHSSGSAQGMNTGVHDAVALAWRLAGVLNGWYKPQVLATYSTERKLVAEQLIENDKIIADLISLHKPDRFKDRPEDPMKILGDFMMSVKSFTLGLGIHYPSNLLNGGEASTPLKGILPGYRAPDVRVRKQGFPDFSVRLFEVTRYNGKFHFLVFTGDIHKTRPLLKALRNQVDRLIPSLEHAISFRTVVLGFGIAFEEFLGVEQFGDAYWDVDSTAHVQYQSSLETGAIVVLRPDGILGFVAPLDGFDNVAKYLSRLIVPRKPQKVAMNGTHGYVGEMLNGEENNLYYQQEKEQGLPQSVEQGAVGKL